MMLREACGGVEPDIVFDSAPCVGATKLVTDEKAATEKYVELNKLSSVWTRLLLQTWRPRLVIKENVPNIVHRARGTIAEVRAMLRKADYLRRHAWRAGSPRRSYDTSSSTPAAPS